MRVLFDTYAFRMQRVGGISRYFAELIRRLPSVGVHPLLFMPMVDNEHAASTGLSHRRSSEILSGRPTLRRVVHGLIRHGEDLLRVAGRYDLLHRTYYSSVARSRRPAVCTIVDMIPELFPQHFGVNPHQNKRQVAADSDLIFSISECTSRDIASVYGIDRSRIVTTPLGIDPQKFNRSATSTNPFRPPYVLFVGQRSGYKNFNRMAKAMEPILLREPQLSVAVVGGGPLTADEMALFGGRESQARVQQATVLDSDLAKIYRQAELFVFPSEYEGFGIPILEAFAAGCPVAASRSSSFPEVGGDAIEYFDPRSIDEISQAVNRIVASRSRADELRALGAERVRLFPWTGTVEKTAQGYRRLA